jgi:cytoskeletal protein CcmA (bactofilin family)
MDTPKTAEFAHIGKSLVVKGELTGSEDLYIDGQVEGSIDLQGNNLTVGPNGQIRANVNAKGVIVQGKLEGNINATERVDFRKSAIAVGDVITQRVAIEDGAYFKGKVDIGKPEPSPPKSDFKPERSSVSSGAAAVGTGSPIAGVGSKTPVTDSKKV